MRLLSASILVALALSLTSTAHAQFKETPSVEGARFGKPQILRYQAGVTVKAAHGPVQKLFATVPVPFAWPEQQVRIVEEDISPEVGKVSYRVLGGTVKQMLVEIPRLASGGEARALVTFEVERRPILAPKDPTIFKIPKRPARDVKQFLGPSPYIESRHRKIRNLAKELVADKENDWAKVEAIYDHVRKTVEYTNGPLKGALAALRDGNGDCEELTSLFIAVCRAAGIPARTVWIPGHCYPEFYLVDEEEQGHWFPCQAAGTRAFGEMPEHRPILQKGDSFRVPEKPKERQRYVAEFLRGSPSPGGGKPKVKFIRQLVD